MKILILVGLVTIASISNAHAMRCGNELVMEGDYVQNVYRICGSPTWSNGTIDAYINKDGDGSNYYLHKGSDGTVRQIDSDVS